MNGWFPEDPVETFRRHVWVNPFWEDHVDDVISAVGVDRVIFGSDWPHIEALPEALQCVDELAHLSLADAPPLPAPPHTRHGFPTPVSGNGAELEGTGDLRVRRR